MFRRSLIQQWGQSGMDETLAYLCSVTYLML